MAKGKERESYDPVAELRRIGKFFAWAASAYGWNQGRLEELDAQMMDIRHEIELGEAKHSKEAAQVYREERAVLQERRGCKDQLEELKPLVDWYASNRSMTQRLAAIQGEITRTRERLANRQYRPRSQERETHMACEQKGAKQ